MTLKTRRILYILFIIAFLIASAAIILYSTGWRLDIQTLSIKKTGAIYIETYPKYVSIKINNEQFPDSSGILKNGTLISNLMPKKYKIEINKEGYFPYYKEIQVEPSLVSELIGIILTPTKPAEENIIPTKLKGEKITNLSNGRIIISNQKTKNNYLYNLSDKTAALNINAVFNGIKKTAAISKIDFHPFEKNKLIIETDNSLDILDIDKLKIENINLPASSEKNQKIELKNWAVKNTDIYFIAKKTNLKSKIENFQLISFSLMAKTNTDFGNLGITGAKKMEVSGDGNNILIIDNLDNFYIFNAPTKNLKLIAKGVLTFAQSFDNKKIAFLSENKLYVYFLENWYKNVPQKSGEIIELNIENNKKINNISWHKDPYHIFVEYNDDGGIKIDFAETDNRDHLNQFPLVQKIKSAYYEAKKENLYFIKDERLYSLKISE